MNLLQCLGTLALGVGGSVLVSAVLLDHTLLSDVTGFPLGPLYGGGLLAVVLGALALHVGKQEEREQRYTKEKGEV